MKRRGFTWIELLVVLVLVVILAAILYPVFMRPNHPPGRPACQQNIRQIGLAIKQYLSDYGERFPIITTGGSAYGWADACQPYVRNTQLFQCPSDTALPTAIFVGSDPNYTGTDPNFTDYFYNLHLSGVSESRIQYLAATIMLGDATPGDARQHSTGGPSGKPAVAKLINRFGQPVGAATRHLDGANYTFADGHVKWLKGKDANTTPAIQNAAASGSKNPTFGIK